MNTEALSISAAQDVEHVLRQLAVVDLVLEQLVLVEQENQFLAGMGAQALLHEAREDRRA